MVRAKKLAADPAPVIHGIKGFDSSLQCRGFQFAPGETYTHDGEVKACQGGFHAIVSTAHPLSVFDYCAPAGSRFFRVEMSGANDTDDEIKFAAEILKVGKEIGITDLVNEAVAWTLARSTPEGETATGIQGAASATGFQGAASATGFQGAASATGTQGAAMTSGHEGKVSGADGNALFCVERETWDGPIISVAAGIVGQDGIEAGVWYRAEAGKLVAS